MPSPKPYRSYVTPQEVLDTPGIADSLSYAFDFTLLPAAERAEQPVSEAPSHREVANWIEDLYPCPQPIAVRLGQRLREVPQRRSSGFEPRA